MKPFDDYPEGGNTILQKMGCANARREDGLWLMQNAHQDKCVYCGISLVDDYYHWLLLNVDHVIPDKECARLGIPAEWYHSFANAVLACFGCNLFDNRYTIKWCHPKPTSAWTVPQFIALRNKVFKERKERIASRRADEIRFFERNIRQNGSFEISEALQNKSLESITNSLSEQTSENNQEKKRVAEWPFGENIRDAIRSLRGK